MRTITQKMTVLAGAALIASGCSTPPPQSGRDATSPPVRETFARSTDPGRVQDNWLATFRDPALMALVEEAQGKNPDLTIASGRLDEARARARKAGAALSPQIGAGVGSARADSGFGANTQTNLNLSISWEVDVWGRVRQGKAGAQQDAMAAAADYEFARQSLAAQTGEAWFYAIGAKQQATIEAELVGVYEKTMEITDARKREGMASQMDVDLAKANLANARQSLSRSEGSREEAVRSLEALLGRYPGAEMGVAGELPEMPGPVPTGLPSGLLERRPDMVAADRRVAAAFYRTGSARAARLPSFSIGADLSSMLNPAATIWSLGGNLLAPIVDGGARAADVEIAEGQQKQALGMYVKTAIAGFQEVETALANEAVLAAREVELTKAAEGYSKARRAAEVSYREGAMSLVDLNSIQSQDGVTRGELVRVKSERLRQRIKLHLALGGSFDGANK